jgi:hypothetical protein
LLLLSKEVLVLFFHCRLSFVFFMAHSKIFQKLCTVVEPLRIDQLVLGPRSDSLGGPVLMSSYELQVSKKSDDAARAPVQFGTRFIG